MPVDSGGPSRTATATYKPKKKKYVPPSAEPITKVGKMPYAQPGITAGGGQMQTIGTAPRPTPPSEGQFLRRDTGYQQSLREMRLNMQNFLADQSRQKGSAREQFRTQKSTLGTQRTRDLKDIEGDFASRGLLQSGLYAGRLGEYEKDFASNMKSYQQAYDDFLRQLAAAQQQLRSQQELESERARQEALARRASRYGL